MAQEFDKKMFEAYSRTLAHITSTVNNAVNFRVISADTALQIISQDIQKHTQEVEALVAVETEKKREEHGNEQ